MTSVKQGIARPPAVDEKFLSADDYEQYQTFLRRWDRRATFREMPSFAVATAIFYIVCIGGFIAIFLLIHDSPTAEQNRAVGLVFALLFAGLVPYVWFARHSLRRWRIKVSTEADTFLRERIKDAPPSDRADEDPGNPYWWTGNYDPQGYYRSFRGMTREDREYISNAYGDRDTYESNRPD